MSSQIRIPKRSVTSAKRKAISDDENDVDKPKHMPPQIIVTEISSVSKERTASFTDCGEWKKPKKSMSIKNYLHLRVVPQA